MLKIDYKMDIEVNQGDSGCLYFGSNPYTFDGGEEITLEILLGDEIVFSKKSSIVDRGLLFLELTEKETKNIPKGNYNYRVFAIYGGGAFREYIVSSKEFKLKEGNIKWVLLNHF